MNCSLPFQYISRNDSAGTTNLPKPGLGKEEGFETLCGEELIKRETPSGQAAGTGRERDIVYKIMTFSIMMRSILYFIADFSFAFQ